MDEFTLPPSPNWQLSNILACNDNGLLAYGSRFETTIIKFSSSRNCEVSFLKLAHKEKVNVVVFSPVKGSFTDCLATCGDDGMVRVWNFVVGRLLYFHSGHKDGLKVTGLDWSRNDSNRLVSVNDLGTIVCWDLMSNTIRRIHSGSKVLPLCLSCCPHDKDLVAIGCKSGITLVIDIKGNGKIIHRLRGNEHDIISTSWCPVPYNVIKFKKNIDTKAAGDSKEQEDSGEKDRDLLLATGGVDKSIYIWRTGSDGRYEVVLNLPNSSITNNIQRKKSNLSSNTTMLWVCVLWVDAYTLLSTTLFGELVCWDLNKVYSIERGNSRKPQPRLLHDRHHKGCFSIACPVVYDAVTDWKADTRTVFTTAMDKHVMACSLGNGKIVLDIPTLGGAVFSMSLSPLDPNRLAIGSSDSKVFVWNMSNFASFNITTYWKKIIGKVMAVCWHPTEENWLAYGTSDGHIGLIDVGSNKVPILFRLHHRKTVYRVVWAPPLLKSGEEAVGSDNASKLVLFTVGDADVFQYTANPLEPDEEPKSMNSAVLNSIDLNLGLKKTLMRSEISIKPDFSSFAVGNDNGSVYIICCSSLTLQKVLYPHKKLINNLNWHPETVASDNNISPYKDWLASCCDNIKVYNIPTEGQAELVATLSGHSLKIVGLAWSPHFNARLLSTSYDNTVQVWDVVHQSCLGVYQEHCQPVMSAMFSPLHPDSIISGSHDNTVRVWKTSQLKASTAKSGKKKELTLNEHTLKERAATSEEATELTVGMSYLTPNEVSNETHNPSNTSSNSHNSSAPSVKGIEEFKKRQKGHGVFTHTGPKLAQSKHFDVLLQRWTASHNPSAPAPPVAVEDVEPPSISDLSYLNFFGDDRAMCRLLMVEESQLTQKKHYLLAQNSALWRGDVTEMITEAVAKKKLSDWLLSIAPLAGFDVWEEACTAYVEQLVECGEILKASSYLLAIHKVHDAVRLLADYKFFREAISIAKCRLSGDDPLIVQVYTDWGHYVKSQGSFILAAHCFLVANDTQSCIESLVRVKELKYLKMAALLAKQTGQTEMADSLAVDCLTMCVTAGNHSVAAQLIIEMPHFQFWSVWVRASELLDKVKRWSESEVFNWLEGRLHSQRSLCDNLTAVCSSCGPVYQRLLQQLPNNKTPEFERDMWLVVSGQLAAACAAKLEATPAHFLRHIISALSACSHFQNNHPQSMALLLTLSLLSPSGLFGQGSIFNTQYEKIEEKQLMKSLKAFVCASVVYWMYNNWEKVNSLWAESEETTVKNDSENCVESFGKYTMNWLPELLSNCSAEVLDAENVSYFVKKAQKQELINVLTKENIVKKREGNKTSAPKHKVSTIKTSTAVDKVEVEKMINQCSVEVHNTNDFRDSNKTVNVDVNLNITAESKTSDGSACNTDVSQMTQDPTNQKNLLSKARGDQVSTEAAFFSNTDQKEKKINSVVASKGSSDALNIGGQELIGKLPREQKLESSEVLVQDKEDKTIKLDPSKPVVSCGKNGSFSFPAASPNAIDDKSSFCQAKEGSDCLKSNSHLAKAVNACENSDKMPSDSTDTISSSPEKEVREEKSSIKENEEHTNPKETEIKKLDEALQKFEEQRVSVPCPFTAYMNIKYLIDNVVKKQDSKLAQSLHETCDRLWKKTQ